MHYFPMVTSFVIVDLFAHRLYKFDDAILMMGTKCTKCYLLILAIHLIQKSLVSKRAIVGLDNA